MPVGLRKLVFERAQGSCEYCLVPEALALSAHQVDHIIAEKHGGQTVSENLALSCSLCNMAKGSDIASVDPHSNAIERFHNPRCDRWVEHFALEKSGCIEPLTAIGRATANLLQLNRSDSVLERRLLIETGDLSVADIN